MNERVKELEKEILDLKDQLKNRAVQDKKYSKRKLWVLKKVAGIFLTPNLKSSIKNFLNELRDKGKVTNDTIADLSANVLKRFTRIGCFTIVVASIPLLILFYQTVLLSSQNNKIDLQNNLITSQNQKISVQAHLEDANRRNNLVFLMDNVLKQISDELKITQKKDSSISPMSLSRLKALGQGFQPYRVLDNDTNNDRVLDSLKLTKLVSPERAQLFLSLINSGIGDKTMREIFDRVNFDYAYLKGSNLEKTKLSKLNFLDLIMEDMKFNYSNLLQCKFYDCSLRNSEFYKANLKFTDSRRSDFSNAFFFNADLTSSNFDNVILDTISMQNTVLKKSRFTDVKFQYADLINADFSQSTLRDVTFNEGAMINTTFKNANLYNVTFIDNLENVDFSGANLRNVDLSKARLGPRVNFTNAKINDLLVGRKDWLVYARDSLKLKGLEELCKTHKVFKSRYNSVLYVNAIEDERYVIYLDKLPE